MNVYNGSILKISIFYLQDNNNNNNNNNYETIVTYSGQKKKYRKSDMEK